MRKLAATAALAVLVTMVGALTIVQANAAPPDSLRGRWMLTLDTPVGRLPVPAEFKHGGVGSLDFGGDVPLAYREGTQISFSAEVPGSLSPTGQPFTLVGRGTRSGDSMTGTALIITDTPDPNRPASDPVQTVVAPASLTGLRQ